MISTTWDVYKGTVGGIAIFVLLLILTAALSFISPFFWLLILLSFFCIPAGMSIGGYESDVPDIVHMAGRHRYKVIDNDLYVRFPMAWVMTRHSLGYGKDEEAFMAKFLQEKNDYRQSSIKNEFEA